MTTETNTIEQRAREYFYNDGDWRLQGSAARIRQLAAFAQTEKAQTLAALEDAVEALGDAENPQRDKAIDAVVELIRTEAQK